jgi:hypothetical protein
MSIRLPHYFQVFLDPSDEKRAESTLEEAGYLLGRSPPISPDSTSQGPSLPTQLKFKERGVPLTETEDVNDQPVRVNDG